MSTTKIRSMSAIETELVAVVQLRPQSNNIKWASAAALEAAGLEDGDALRYKAESTKRQLIGVGVDGERAIKNVDDTVRLRVNQTTIPDDLLRDGLGIDPDTINGDRPRVEVYAGDGVLLFKPARTLTVDQSTVDGIRERENPLVEMPPATREDFRAVVLEGMSSTDRSEEADKDQSTVYRNAQRGREICERLGVDVEDLKTRYEAGELQ